MRVSTMSPVPICKLSALHVHMCTCMCVCVIACFTASEVFQSGCILCVWRDWNENSWKKRKSEHLGTLSKIWQLNNRFAIHSHIQCHYLTSCLAGLKRVQIERQCHMEKEMSCLLQGPFKLLPFTALLNVFLYPDQKHSVTSTFILSTVSDEWQYPSGRSAQFSGVDHSSPNILRAQWAAGGLSARQKGSATEWVESQASWWFFFFFRGASPSL